MSKCKMELCPQWSGNGDVCPCALFAEAASIPTGFSHRTTATELLRHTEDTNEGTEGEEHRG